MKKIIQDTIYIPQLDRERTLRIYLPPNYDDSDKSFPVFYMHDGQNLFNKKDSSFGMIWDVANTMDSVIEQNKYMSCIVVGIDNVGDFRRLDEYSPWKSNIQKLKGTLINNKKIAGGEGDKYSKFFVETLIPYINSNYKTIPNKNYIGGSSMGGLISLYIGLSHPEIFSKIMAMSTAVWFAKNPLFDFIKTVSLRNDLKIYLDIGTKETSNDSIKEFPNIYLNDSKQLFQLLYDRILQKNNLKFIIDEGAPHNELQWARRFPEAIKWLLE